VEGRGGISREGRGRGGGDVGGEGREGRAGNQTGFMPPTEPTEGTNDEALAVYLLVFALFPIKNLLLYLTIPIAIL
jgi:hypothetical protein